jgi:hypothetical protein
VTIRMASLDTGHGVSVGLCYQVGRTERGKKPNPGFSPPSISEAGRITPLALNGQMRASEPEG